MRQASRPLFLLYFCVLTCLFAGKVCADEKLLVISLDGFRYDYMDTYAHLLPNLRFLAANGVHAVNGMKSTMATMTFPAHYTMATGLNEESHGLVANAFWDRQSNHMFAKNTTDKTFYQGEPIWVTAKKHALKTGVVIWIGSAVNWAPHHPDFNLPYDGSPLKSRVDKALALLNSGSNLVMVYLDEPDSVQHSNGTFSIELQKTLANLDQLMQPVVQNVTHGSLANKVNVVVLSDHGMLNVTNLQRINITEVIEKGRNITAMNLNTFTNKQVDALFSNNLVTADSGVVSHLYLRNGEYNRTLQATLMRRLITSNDSNRIFQAIYSTVYNVKPDVDDVVEWRNLTLYLKSQLPERWFYKNHERIGDLVIVGKPGAMVNTFTANVTLWQHAANHGYDNDLREMRALFIGYGPYFKRGYPIVEAFPQKCIYSLMCDILRIKPAPNNGTLAPFIGVRETRSNGQTFSLRSTAPLWLISLPLLFAQAV